MQIFNFSLKADNTCKLVNTQISLDACISQNSEAYIPDEWLVERSPEISIFPLINSIDLFLFLILFFEVRKEVHKFQQLTFLHISRTVS